MKTIIITTVVQIVLFFSLFFLLEANQDKTAYVRLDTLYEKFKLKQDLETKYKSVETQRKVILDSLELDLRLLYKKYSSGKVKEKEASDFEGKKEYFLGKKQQFEEDNKVLMEDYHQQIITKINECVAEYGKQENFQFIFGADGNGTVMHVQESKDITENVLQFINSRYN